jgi:hypothetical protein
MTARPGSRDYGYFSAFTQLYSKPEILLRIPPGAFQPPPEVSSALVEISKVPEGLLRAEKKNPAQQSAFSDASGAGHGGFARVRDRSKRPRRGTRTGAIRAAVCGG